MTAPQFAVVAEGLRKRYGGTEALAGLDLAVPAGTVHGLLGPNGAGKTTAVRVLTTLTRPDGGTATVAGHDVVRGAARVRTRVGLVGQHAAVDEVLSGRQNLVMFGRLYHLGSRTARRRADELLERFRLTEAAGRPAGQYSGGMRRRLDLAASMILAPPVLFLDEPTTGLDPRSRTEVWDEVRALVEGGTTVLLTTQYLEEADRLADGISVIDHGRVIAEGAPDRLKARLGGDRVEVVLDDPSALADAAAILARAVGAEAEVDAAALRVGAPAAGRAAALTEAVRALDAAGVRVADIGLRRPTLDEVFLHLTGDTAQDRKEVPA
ncbi:MULTISPECIES: ATP-binding cassette domain-containing protein [Actinomadura]|uniref:ATP-binding cassette domain-containing protein n=1 Tax=Actinomadura litoris TaxID=2678616 RepID=A0A7K1KWQ7_9ACTN|nr:MULTISPECIES: ATP-binding cassette domain-containing protein [Actinomadura]MBT2211575.1 ATP-binding cassette domain-containing protein [Actinomadura sp. NEAU-AAG7]MUN36497.1 ATP-binding cassette domain-containing protein [Actinomadura litoris]